LAELIRPLFEEDLASFSANAAAQELERRNIRTPRGGAWLAKQVIRLRQRLGLRSEKAQRVVFRAPERTVPPRWSSTSTSVFRTLSMLDTLLQHEFFFDARLLGHNGLLSAFLRLDCSLPEEIVGGGSRTVDRPALDADVLLA